ncbi:hypothetical protein [Methanobacterium oryzae]|uniref:hypothetical protein n=1 Tax=Methanobacterium oryzae TaxID=69540 RepID=UPI003D24B54F
MEINIEQCRENDLIKRIISKSGLPIKLIKLLLRFSDAIYINAINYNVIIEENRAILILISSKPENKTGYFHTISLSNVLYKLRDIEKENDDIKTKLKAREDMIHVIIEKV